MKSILFLCHGNICRSLMAEFVMKKLLAGVADPDKLHQTILDKGGRIKA